MRLDDGVLMVLPRDEAKQFFGFRDDQARLDFIDQLLASDSIRKANCEGKWQQLDTTLRGVELEQSYLGHAILGGRDVQQSDDHHVIVVRPDIVGFVAQQLQQVDIDQPDLSPVLERITELYAQAANLRGAVVFAAKRSRAG